MTPATERDSTGPCRTVVCPNCGAFAEVLGSQIVSEDPAAPPAGEGLAARKALDLMDGIEEAILDAADAACLLEVASDALLEGQRGEARIHEEVPWTAGFRIVVLAPAEKRALLVAIHLVRRRAAASEAAFREARRELYRRSGRDA